MLLRCAESTNSLILLASVGPSQCCPLFVWCLSPVDSSNERRLQLLCTTTDPHLHPFSIVELHLLEFCTWVYPQLLGCTQVDTSALLPTSWLLYCVQAQHLALCPKTSQWVFHLSPVLSGYSPNLSHDWFLDSLILLSNPVPRQTLGFSVTYCCTGSPHTTKSRSQDSCF